jgi:hypothetical protein
MKTMYQFISAQMYLGVLEIIFHGSQLLTGIIKRPDTCKAEKDTKGGINTQYHGGRLCASSWLLLQLSTHNQPGCVKTINQSD